MEIILYPRIPVGYANERANELRSMTIQDLRTKAAISDARVYYAPTGGGRASENHLKNIADSIRELAAEGGYPSAFQRRPYSEFDSKVAEFLHRTLQITPSEAARLEIWSFFTCILLPDVVRWRFHARSRPTSLERYLGGIRGVRNTFGRLWWRGEILQIQDTPRPYQLVHQLTEDQLVQLMERPGLSGNRTLATAISQAFLSAADSHPEVTRDDLMRDTTKRIRRLLAFVSFDGLEAHELHSVVSDAIEQTLQMLQYGHPAQTPSSANNLVDPQLSL